MRINFATNWNNKLDCPSFTTIRIRPYKGKVYLPNQKTQIYLKDKFLFDAKIVQVKDIKLQDIDDFIAYTDAGYNSQDLVRMLRAMYKNKSPDLDNQRFCYILLNRIYETGDLCHG